MPIRLQGRCWVQAGGSDVAGGQGQNQRGPGWEKRAPCGGGLLPLYCHDEFSSLNEVTENRSQQVKYGVTVMIMAANPGPRPTLPNPPSSHNGEVHPHAFVLQIRKLRPGKSSNFLVVISPPLSQQGGSFIHSSGAMGTRERKPSSPAWEFLIVYSMRASSKDSPPRARRFASGAWRSGWEYGCHPGATREALAGPQQWDGGDCRVPGILLSTWQPLSWLNLMMT